VSVFKKYISNIEEETAATSSASVSQSSEQTKVASSSAPVSQAAASQPAPSKPSAPTSTVAATNGRNVLSSDVEIKGKVKFTNDLVVDGLIEGEIYSDGSLTVGENARIKAEIHTRSVVVYGKVHGNITVTDRVELKANAELIGDIKAATISIEAGAIFVGQSTVGAPSTQAIGSNASSSSSKPAKDKLATA
jgi:cytoskeletal protein CcmA (bactofilin family)